MKKKEANKMPTKEELRKKYDKFNNNAGLMKVRKWTMPNDSPKTNEVAVNNFMANDDEDVYLSQSISILSDMKE